MQHSDTCVTQLSRQRLAEVVHGKIGGGVEGADRDVDQLKSRQREDVDVHGRAAALGLLEECGQEALDQGHARVEVDVHDAIQHRHVTLILELPHALSAVVHENINWLWKLLSEGEAVRCFV